MSSQDIYENKSASSIFLTSKLKMRANQAFSNRYIHIKRDQVAVVISYGIHKGLWFGHISINSLNFEFDQGSPFKTHKSSFLC